MKRVKRIDFGIRLMAGWCVGGQWVVKRLRRGTSQRAIVEFSRLLTLMNNNIQGDSPSMITPFFPSIMQFYLKPVFLEFLNNIRFTDQNLKLFVLLLKKGITPLFFYCTYNKITW